MNESEQDKLIREQREARRNTIATVNRQMSIEQLKEQIDREKDIDEEDERMDIVIRNGNIGYKEI